MNAVALAVAATELGVATSTLQHRAAREKMGLTDCAPPPFFKSARHKFVTRESLELARWQQKSMRALLRGDPLPEPPTGGRANPDQTLTAQ
jgi:hypothetical protein